MVTVLPSLAAIEPRSRVTGLCAMAAAAAMKATAAATQPASRRMGVIGILPGDTGLWHGSRRARVYDCVMGLWVKVPLIRAAYSGSRAYCPRGHAKKSFVFKPPKGSTTATGAYLFQVLPSSKLAVRLL